MVLSPLTAVSPIDGRYHSATSVLSLFFSESALIRYRVYVEIEYFIALCEQGISPIKAFNKDKYEDLRAIYKQFTIDDALKVKEIEKTTNHDVKADRKSTRLNSSH